MGNLISLVDKIQLACTALGDHGESSSLPTLWDAFPSVTVDGGEEIGFECIPTSLMERVLNFLYEVREDLRSSMAKNIVTIKNGSLNMAERRESIEEVSSSCVEKLELTSNF